MVSTLTRIFGPRYVELAEEVVQDALLKALEIWPFEGLPQNPAGWLMQVAKNRALDAVRREASLLGKLPEIERAFPQSSAPDHGDPQAFADDQLSMIFLCCHPAFTRETQIALTLKTVGGFSAAEIARAFFTQEATIAQRIVRAKRQIRDQSLRFEMPAGSDLSDRLDSVLDVLYLMFNEGYSAHSG
ncbi:MAG: sigma-70 family RNA polymerase sigma factor, partial [Acidobacteriota bacterium]|nr:sigma-70 family RNA polymerase sigma factor [Acidobacteriota bacterium]